MRNFILGLPLFFFMTAFAQQDARTLVREGVALHDKGQFDEAIQKYDAALALDNGFYLAHYEKSYTLMLAKRYDESIALSKYILKNFKDGPDNASVYVNYGTCLDYLGKPDEAVDVYNDGIRAFPKVGLLYFNKAIALANGGKIREAVDAVKLSIAVNPYHASSHHVLSLSVREKNKIFGLLSSLVFLAIEPEGKRAELHLANVQSVLGGNAKKTGENAVTINLDPSVLSTKDGGEDNFQSLEMLISLSAGTDFEDKYKAETATDKLQRKIELVISMLGETDKGKKGFGWTYYAPFFIKLKKEKYLKTFSHFIYSPAGDAANAAWLTENKADVDEFVAWFKSYWKTKE